MSREELENQLEELAETFEEEYDTYWSNMQKIERSVRDDMPSMLMSSIEYGGSEEEILDFLSDLQDYINDCEYAVRQLALSRERYEELKDQLDELEDSEEDDEE